MTNDELSESIAKLLPLEYEDTHVTYGLVKPYATSWGLLMPLVAEHSLKFETFYRGKHFLVRMVSKDNRFVITQRADTLERALAECLYEILEYEND